MAKEMEQFDKWLRGQSQIPAFPRYGTIDEDCAAGEAWRAALECVRDTIIYESDGPSNPKDLMEWLNEELGNE